MTTADWERDRHQRRQQDAVIPMDVQTRFLEVNKITFSIS